MEIAECEKPDKTTYSLSRQSRNQQQCPFCRPAISNYGGSFMSSYPARGCANPAVCLLLTLPLLTRSPPPHPLFTPIPPTNDPHRNPLPLPLTPLPHPP